MKCGFYLLVGVLLVSCGGPKGRLAMPEQNVAERFVSEDGYRPRWDWTTPGGPAILSLAVDGRHEMMWSVREKSMDRVRRSRLRSLQTPPRFFSQGPEGVREVRFSPSGETILAHEVASDGVRFQTVLFQFDSNRGAWRSRYLDLGKPEETKLRKLDDRSQVAAVLAPAVAPTILRLDEEVVIYEVEGKTRSLGL